MKKMLLATALALLITGCAQQTFTVQNKPAAVAPKETITSGQRRAGQKKGCRSARVCGKCCWVEQQTFVKMDCSVLLL